MKKKRSVILLLFVWENIAHFPSCSFFSLHFIHTRTHGANFRTSKWTWFIGILYVCTYTQVLCFIYGFELECTQHDIDVCCMCIFALFVLHNGINRNFRYKVNPNEISAVGVISNPYELFLKSMNIWLNHWQDTLYAYSIIISLCFLFFWTKESHFDFNVCICFGVLNEKKKMCRRQNIKKLRLYLI